MSSDIPQSPDSLGVKSKNIWQLLENAASSGAGHGISIYAAGDISQVGIRLTYRELLRQANLRGHIVQKLNYLSPGSVVLLHFDNHLDGISWFWAVVAAGCIPAISTPFSHDVEARRKHIIHLQNILQKPLILTSDRLVPEFLDLEDLNVRTIETLQIREEELPLVRPLAPVPGSLKSEDAIAAIMLTSGSTGHAKAVALRHGQLITSVRGKSFHHGTTQDDKFLNWIGLDHVANLIETHIHSMSLASDQIHVQASDLVIDPMKFLILIDRHQITHSFAPNFFLTSLRTALENPKPFGSNSALNLSCLRVLISGGEQTVVETVQVLTRLLAEYGCKGEVVRPGFGMTETCAGSIYNRSCPSYDVSQKSEFASLGHCVPGISMRITNDFGEVLSNEIGNLEVSGPIVFKEYFNNSKVTTDSFSEDGWFKTGDRALIDNTGRLQMTGRAKEDIIINGVKYFPHEIENALEEARINGLTPSYTTVFPHRPKGSPTEVLCVVYLPSYDENDILARVKATDQISTICTMQCGVRPFEIIPLSTAHLSKTSLGKLSRAKIRAAFEGGSFTNFKTTNDSLINAHRASQIQGPTNHAESIILSVFAETFEMPEQAIGINTSLFEMGVSSIEIIRVKTKIQTALSLKVEIPIIAIMKNPTISSLATAILTLQTPKAYNPVVILHSGGSNTPLFLVHPGVGEVLVFLNLAKYIVDRPVYALRARGFDVGEKPFSSIPKIVTTYHAAIKVTQPAGPYAIAGYSYGSMLAVEIAKVLESQGYEVKFLGVLNLPPHIKFRMRQLDWISVLLHLCYFLGLMTEEHVLAISPTFYALKADHDPVLDEIIAQSSKERMEEMALDKEKLKAWTDIGLSLQKAATEYDPSGMVGTMDVFFAEPLAEVATNKKQWMDDHLMKWKEFVRGEGEVFGVKGGERVGGGVRFHEVDGAHYTMLASENVVSFQKKLRIVLRDRGL